MTQGEIWMLVIAALALISSWIQNQRKQKNEVSFTDVYTRKEEFDEYKETNDRRVEGIRAEILHHLAEQDRQASIHRSSIYRKIDESRVEIERKLDDKHRELDGDIKAMPNQVVTLLKNTGALK